MTTIYFYTARIFNADAHAIYDCGNYSTPELAMKKALLMCEKYGFEEECADVLEREFDLDTDIEELI